MSQRLMQDDIAAALRDMLGADVGVGVTDPRDAIDDLRDTERPAIARAIPKRVHEFAAGRRAARIAMAELGLAPVAIGQGPQRAPVWPAGLTGSIAHCDGLCIAAVSQGHRGLGLDIEPATPLDPDLIDIICTPQEQALLPRHDRGLVTKQIFCAKEAVYKAQFPLTGQVIGFDALSIRFGPDDRFDVTPHPPLGDLPALTGMIRIQGEMILAICRTQPDAYRLCVS